MVSEVQEVINLGKAIAVRLVILLLVYGVATVASYYTSLSLAEVLTAMLSGAYASMLAEDLGY